MVTTESTKINDCEILVQAAVPEIYKLNAFRISGLQIDAGTREITNQLRKNQMLEKYGDVAQKTESPFPIVPAPGNEQIRSALHRLRDPETRLIDEFFWFWPHNINSHNNDDALQKLSQNDMKSAESIWINQEAMLTQSNVSKHNLAILSHLQALDYELNGKGISKNETKKIDRLWNSSFKRWKLLFDHEGFWSHFTARVRKMDDPRLTTGFIKRLRDMLPSAILQINALLALQAAENGKEDEAERYMELIHNSGFDNDAVLNAIKRVVGPIRNRVKIICKSYADEIYSDPKENLIAAQKLIEQTKPLLKLIDLLLQKDSPLKEGAHDNVALDALNLVIDYCNKTDDANLPEALKLYERFETIVLGESATARVKREHKTIKTNHEYNQTYEICFYCKKNKQDEDCAIEHDMHGEVKRDYIYNRINWRHLTVKIPRCKQCRDIHNKKTEEHKKYQTEKRKLADITKTRNKRMTIGTILSIAAGITIGIMMHNYWHEIDTMAAKYGNVLLSNLNMYEIFIHNNLPGLWWIGLLVGIAGVLASNGIANKLIKRKRQLIKQLKQSIKQLKQLIKQVEQSITPYERWLQFPQILDLRKKGWADGSKPNTEGY